MKKKLISIVMVLILFTTLFLFFSPQEAQAATITWDGGGDGVHWSDPDNWSDDTLPTGLDTISIEGVTDVTVTLDINFTCCVSATTSIALTLTLGLSSDKPCCIIRMASGLKSLMLVA